MFLPFATGDLHLEVHDAGQGGAAAIILVPGIGAHARFHSPALGAFCMAGIHAIGLDRPGHGLSSGRRGHAPVEMTIDAVRTAADYAKERFGTKVALIGHSLGGVDAWYALTTRRPVADVVVCAGTVSHPDVLPTRQARLRAPVVRGLAHVLPHLSISIRQTAPFEHVALSPEILRVFERRDDDVWCWRYTVSALASYLTFSPERDWREVQTPTLIVAGDADRMTSPDALEAVLNHSRPPHAELQIISGAGHMLLHERLPDTIGVLTQWLNTHLP